MSYAYFAYGSNLDAAHFTAWCGEHGYSGVSLERGAHAELDDWELTLTVPSRYWGGAVGTIRPRQGGLVHGIMFTLPDEAAPVIRHKEGVTTGLYREVEVEVRAGGTAGGTMYLRTASVYVAADGREVALGSMAPSTRWLETVRTGGAKHGLNQRWLDHLGKGA